MKELINEQRDKIRDNIKVIEESDNGIEYGLLGLLQTQLNVLAVLISVKGIHE